MDRASGSGVFARDPDALIDLLELEVTKQDEPPFTGTAWRLEGTLREFPRFEPLYLWFQYPLHMLDHTGFLEELFSEDSSERGRRRGNATKKEQKEDRKAKMQEAIRALKGFSADNQVTVEEVANYMQLSVKTVRNYLKDSDEFEVREGAIFTFID